MPVWMAALCLLFCIVGVIWAFRASWQQQKKSRKIWGVICCLLGLVLLGYLVAGGFLFLGLD